MTTDSARIWHEFHERLRAFIAQRVESRADVDDILQEVFLRIHRGGGTLRRADRLVAWLFQVTRNAIADHYRAPARRAEIATDFTEAADGRIEVEAAGVAVDASSSEMEESAALEQLSACLRPTTRDLPPLYGEAIRLVELEGLTHPLAAARVGISVSGMKSRVQRGRLMLRRKLEECCEIHLSPAGAIQDFAPRGSGCDQCGAPTSATSTGCCEA